MVMVPQETSGLAIGVVIVLVFSWESQVLCPAVEWSTGWRSVKMNRVLTISVVQESHHTFSATGHDDSRTWRATVVANEAGRLKVWKDLLSEWLDFKLIVPDLLASDWVNNFPESSQSHTRECYSSNTYCLTCATGGIGSATEYNE